jgi:hypothetical protein
MRGQTFRARWTANYKLLTGIEGVTYMPATVGGESGINYGTIVRLILIGEAHHFVAAAIYHIQLFPAQFFFKELPPC